MHLYLLEPLSLMQARIQALRFGIWLEYRRSKGPHGTPGPIGDEERSTQTLSPVLCLLSTQAYDQSVSRTFLSHSLRPLNVIFRTGYLVQVSPPGNATKAQSLFAAGADGAVAVVLAAYAFPIVPPTATTPSVAVVSTKRESLFIDPLVNEVLLRVVTRTRPDA